MPKKGDSSSILSITKNLLARLAPDAEPFSVFGFIWEEISRASESGSKIYPYAPYIMFMIENVTNKIFDKERKHLKYLPRVGDTIRPRGGKAPRGSSRVPPPVSAPSPGSSTTSPIHSFLRAIFNVCKSNSVEIAKNTQRTKQIYRHLNLSPLFSPDREPPMFEDPFAAYEATQRAAGASSSRPPVTEEEEEDQEICEMEGSGDSDDTEMEEASGDEEEGSDE